MATGEGNHRLIGGLEPLDGGLGFGLQFVAGQ